MTDYKLRLNNAAGTLKAEIVDFTYLAYTRGVNDPGVLAWRLRGDHKILVDIDDKWEVELWRRPRGGEWALELVGLLRDEDWGSTTSGDRFDGVALGIMDMLAWRVINYPAGVDTLSRFVDTPGQTIMTRLVNYNAGPNATTANGRKRAGTLSQITAQADGGGGLSLNWYCHGQNLLASLQELAPLVGGDFDLVKTGAGAYQFRWYEGQLGTDRTATVTFATSLGNMGNPRYRMIRSGEATVACVWGQGEGSQRDYTTITGANYAADNDIEVYVDARNVPQGSTSALQGKGEERLDKMQARPAFSFDVIQIPGTRYGEHYFLGDLVTAINPYTGEAHIQKIQAVTIVLNEKGQEAISVETRTP